MRRFVIGFLAVLALIASFYGLKNLQQPVNHSNINLGRTSYSQGQLIVPLQNQENYSVKIHRVFLTDAATNQVLQEKKLEKEIGASERIFLKFSLTANRPETRPFFLEISYSKQNSGEKYELIKEFSAHVS